MSTHSHESTHELHDCDVVNGENSELSDVPDSDENPENHYYPTNLCPSCEIIRLGLIAAKATRKCYEELDSLKFLVDDTFKFFELANHTLLAKIESYQRHVSYGKKRVDKHTVAKTQLFPKCRRTE